MVKNYDRRTTPAVSSRQVMRPPQRLSLRSAHEWINEQTEEKGAQATQNAALGVYAVHLNTTMTTSNADSTVRGMDAMEEMRPDGTSKHDRRVSNVLDAFQEDLVDGNRRINAVASENILHAVNTPFRQPDPTPKQRSGWDKFWGIREDE